MLLVCASAIAQTGGFQVKGVRLGAAPEEVCGSVPVTDKMSDLIATMGPQGRQLKPMGTNECEGSIDSFAEVSLASPSSMLFHDRRLIGFKLEVRPMEMTRLANVMDALTGEYGKPVVKRSKAITTFTWRRSGQTLILERESASWDENYLTLILRDDKRFDAYQRAHAANRKLLDEADRRSVRDSVLK